jgi:hypothetical protein
MDLDKKVKGIDKRMELDMKEIERANNGIKESIRRL